MRKSLTILITAALCLELCSISEAAQHRRVRSETRRARASSMITESKEEDTNHQPAHHFQGRSSSEPIRVRGNLVNRLRNQVMEVPVPGNPISIALEQTLPPLSTPTENQQNVHLLRDQSTTSSPADSHPQTETSVTENSDPIPPTHVESTPDYLLPLSSAAQNQQHVHLPTIPSNPSQFVLHRPVTPRFGTSTTSDRSTDEEEPSTQNWDILDQTIQLRGRTAHRGQRTPDQNHKTTTQFGSSQVELELRERKMCNHVFGKFMDWREDPDQSYFMCDGQKEDGTICERNIEAREVFYGCGECNIDLCMECIQPITCEECQSTMKIVKPETTDSEKEVPKCDKCESRFGVLQCPQNEINGHPCVSICTR